MWAAFDATYYVGGRSTVDGIENNDRQSNSRVGATVAFPVGRRHSIKLAVSKGAIVRARRRLQHVLLRVADGLGPASYAHPVVWCARQFRRVGNP